MGEQARALVALAMLTALAAGAALFVTVHTGSGRSDRPGSLLEVGSEQASLFDGQVLVWGPAGFTGPEVDRVRDSSLVATIAAVRTGFLRVASGVAAYPAVPVETMAVDPNAYGATLRRSYGTRVAAMLYRGVVLSATGARLRKLEAGGRLRLHGGRTLPVAGVVDDAVVGGHEAVMERRLGAQYGLTSVSYLLVRPRGSRDELAAAVGRLLPGRELQFLVPSERTWFRGGDAALPLGAIKARFGEPPMRPGGKGLTIDPRWVKANVAGRDLPVLGSVRCHELVLDSLAAAMAELERERLGGLVDTADLRSRGGCFRPRPRSGESGLSRHLWGIAIDLNVAANPPGRPPRQDARLVQVMARHGFAWAGRWLRPDGAHFEWVGPGIS